MDKFHEPEVKAKLQGLVFLMWQKPCEINLADLVILRRRLLLTVSYLVSKFCKHLYSIGSKASFYAVF